MRSLIRPLLGGALLLASSLTARALSPSELWLRQEAQAKIAAGDYAGAEAALKRLIAVRSISSELKPDPPAEEPQATAKEQTFFERLSNAGFVLQRTAGNPGEADPAEFSFLRDFESGVTTYTADFFLSFSPNRVRNPETGRLVHPSYHPFGPKTDLKLEVSAEAKLSSEADATATDALRFRLTGTLDTSSIGGFFDSTYTTFSLKSESDQNFETSRLSAELWFTPTKSSFAIGRYQPQPADRYPILFRWRPYIGVDLGGTVSSGQVAPQSTDQRLMFRTTASLLFPSLAASLHFHEISLFADNYVYYLFDEDVTQDYLTAGANFMFNENVGFKLTLKLGRDAPQFAEEKTLGGALSVKF